MDTEHQQIFDEMKRTTTHQLEINMSDTSKPFFTLTDASNPDIGAALLQKSPTKK